MTDLETGPDHVAGGWDSLEHGAAVLLRLQPDLLEVQVLVLPLNLQWIISWGKTYRVKD